MKLIRQVPGLKSGLLWGGSILVLGLSVWWRLQNIDAFGLTNDEGAYLMWSRLVAAGYPLYRQTYTGSPPLFIDMLALVFRLLGFGIVLGRLVVLGWYVILAGLLAYLGQRLAGWVGTYAALVMVAFLPPIFSLSRQVMIELPALTLALAAVLAGYAFWVGKPVGRWGRHTWLVLAGLLLGGSTMMKILHPLAALPILYFIWRGADSNGNRIRAAALFGGALLGTIVLLISLHDVKGFLDQAIGFRVSTRDSGTLPLESNAARLLAYIGSLWGLSLLALAGLLVSWRQVRGQVWGLWLLANLALVMWYQPLFPHHFTLVLLPTILLALEFVAFCRAAPATTWFRFGVRWGWLIVLIAVANLPSLLRANQAIVAITTGGREAEAAAILAQVTRPTDFVMTDSQLLALYADRLTPPPLVDFSLVYIKSGRQTPQRLIAMAQDYPVTAVASWALRMVWLPEYLDWVEEQYWVRKVWDHDHVLYFGPKHPPHQPIPHGQTTPFVTGITLAGYQLDLAETDIKAGQPLPLTLYWQARQPVQVDYTFFVQLLNEAGMLVAQHDRQPLSGYFPTNQWPSGEIIPDRVQLDLPADMPAGTYRLIVGMYDWRTLERATLLDSQQDYVSLMMISIK